MSFEIQVQHFVGMGEEANLATPKLGEQPNDVGIVVLWVCATIFLGKQLKVAMSTLSSLTTDSDTCDKNKNKNQTLYVMLCLHI